MIDIHCHILPGIDDGARNVEETIDMIKEAYRGGCRAICSTSHYMEGSYEADSDQRKEIIARIEEVLKQEKIEMPIYIGAEAYVSTEIPVLIKHDIIPTLNHSRYLLFELPMNTNILYLDDVVFSLLSENIIPIMAHPERYTCVQENPNLLLEWIDKGILFQMNIGSLSGIYGKTVKKTALKLIKANMIHFLATDAHRHHSIYADLPQMMENAEKIMGTKKLKKLTQDNPLRVVKNEEIEIENPIKIKRFFF